MNPRVSVLLPVRDGAATLERALGSLRGQTLTEFECLVVDDGSRDATPEILATFSRADNRFRVLTLPPSGLVPALRAGLEACRGGYVARMDADDVCLPRRLELQAAHLDAHPGVGLVSCRVAHGGDVDRQGGYAHHVRWANSLLGCEQLALARFRESPLPHPSVMFRRELVALYGGYREGDFPEDYELWLRWFEAGVRMEKLPQELLVWNDPPERLSRTDPRYGVERFYELKARYLARWLERNNPLHPWISVLGAGRVSRKRAEMLCAHGVRIEAWYDIDPRKVGREVGGRPVLHREAAPSPGERFLVSYVASRDAGEDIAAFLEARGYVAGHHYLLAA